MKAQLKPNSFKGLILLSLFSIVSLKVSAQSHREIVDNEIVANMIAYQDSIGKLKTKKFPVYVGGELSLSVPQYTLKSDIPALAGLRVNFLGTNIGGVISNPMGKIKANAGLYYSGNSVPHEMDMAQGSLSASAYVLRLKEVTYHTVEPYVTIGVSYQGTKFRGRYLPISENGSSTQDANYSSTEQPLLGRTGFTLVNIVAGIEYQLESINDSFIHLFAEAGYGTMVHASSSNHAFNSTTIMGPSTITLGINFGILK